MGVAVMNHILKEQGKRQIHCFFSGGRDSAISCTVSKRVADIKGWGFKLVHIDTTASLPTTRDYVFKFAEWLKAELVIIRPKKSFREYAEEIGMWPALRPPEFRWCYFKLKLEPTIQYLSVNYRNGDLVVLGVKRWDSDPRFERYKEAFFIRNYGKIKAIVWAPLWNVKDELLEKLITRLGIPKNPVWKFGTSGECLCLAGMSERKIRIILKNCPEAAKMLLEVDDAIQRNRKSGKPSAPPSLWKAGFKTLHEYYQYIIAQKQLDEYIIPYSSCEGKCML